MRLLVLPSYYGFGGDTTLGKSGAGVFFRRQAEALSNVGHEVTVGYLHFDSEKTCVDVYSHSDTFREVFIHTKPWGLGLNSSRRAALLTRHLGEFHGRTAFDIVHAHNFAIGPDAWILARSLGVPLVLTEHSSGILRGLPRRSALSARMAYHGSSQLIAVSQSLASGMRRYTGKEVKVVGNLLSSAFTERPIRAACPDRPFTFVSVGYDSEIKGWVDLITAFSQLNHHLPQSRLVLVGSYRHDGAAFQAARSSNAYEAISFVGKQEQDALIRTLDSSDVYVMSSRLETFGIAPIEALARGKPAILTPTGIAPEISSLPGVLLVKSTGAQHLRDAMEAAVSAAVEADPFEISRSIRSLFSEEQICAKLTGIYREVRSR